MVRKIIVLPGSIPIPCLEQTYKIFWQIPQPVKAVRVFSNGSNAGQVLTKVDVCVLGLWDPREDTGMQCHINRAPNRGYTPQGINAATRKTNVA